MLQEATLKKKRTPTQKEIVIFFRMLLILFYSFAIFLSVILFHFTIHFFQFAECYKTIKVSNIECLSLWQNVL